MAFPDVILFDLDDTIISFDGVSKQAWEECCREFVQRNSLDTGAEAVQAKISQIAALYWSDPERHRLGRLNLAKTRRVFVKSALEELGINDETLSNALADSYTKRRIELVHLFPRSLETLAALKSSDIRLGVITNGTTDEQRGKLNRFNLTDFFDLTLVEQEMGFGKPDLRVFELALDYFKADAKNVWMVGDNLVWDIQAPQKLGIYTVWNDYRRKGLPDNQIIPDRIVGEIYELLGLIGIG